MTLKQLLITSITVIIVVGGYYTLDYYQINLKTLFVQKTDKSAQTENSPVQEVSEVATNLMIVNEATDYKLPSGEQVYNVSHGETVVGPKAERVSYFPLAFDPNTKQVITITFPSSETVSSGVVFVTTDNQENQKVTLKKIPGNKNIWQGEWTPDDTINSRYSARLYFIGPSGTYNNVMNFL